MLVRSKLFSQFVEKIEKLELSLSKQHNKMLKIRSEMLKIINNDQAREKFSREFPESRAISGTRKFPGIIPGIPGKFLHKFSFSRKLKIRKIGKP